jgi:hypothetical protein
MAGQASKALTLSRGIMGMWGPFDETQVSAGFPFRCFVLRVLSQALAVAVSELRLGYDERHSQVIIGERFLVTRIFAQRLILGTACQRLTRAPWV